ncbi:DUF2268 domain-containing putative Zn-dependent protease [Thalassotalea sp. 1_MG-2023]|uniref:DUF2268 domain-containing putative Zn-dependent protease n=1 Tax=Thalassotalea sp. 1_MG-2023 TaxID=3062680 RepID=UPI0026E2DE8C|nr:DUF2268 domain-containing putative Zn-dependent protease [Thalassotalea sp. 1_MG-2023]MDO6426853.1 DUF2268 domain-containing putative Zn-dependent protease [Thalassotalea sp. 1_MG-2023]
MSTKITVLNASGKFNHVLGLLESKAQDSLIEIEKHIVLPNLDIVISPCLEEYKNESGIMGSASPQVYVIDIGLDSDRKDLVDIINNKLTAVIAHEIHHVLRSTSGVKENKLFQVLISEGLACHFETKFNKHAVNEFFDEVRKYEWLDLYNKMQTNLENTDFNYPVFFGGKDVTKFPNRAGYWVGFNLVSEYIDRFGGCAITLVGTPAEELVVAVEKVFKTRMK